MKEEDETSLIEGLRSGRRETFQLAVTRYSGAMIATARAIAGHANADDIVQDAWLTVFERIDSFEGRSSLKTWLQRIVANRAISYLRSRSREVSQLG
ncbi:MAG: sigma-70 family RNA polymerase sigma factor, partial [Proteobacteria bacterium]|nr:sigma-70 family RNA polymerase sigma factor [Pseudomonadota bacterium]